jgi:DNA-binding transcriptional ArsR family regulator
MYLIESNSRRAVAAGSSALRTAGCSGGVRISPPWNANQRHQTTDSAYAESVIRYHFGSDDLLRTRFAITPVFELIGAVYALRSPQRYGIHRPWVEWARPRIADLDLRLLDVATPSGGPYWPTFCGPPPRVPRAEIDDELARIHATPPDRVAAEIARSYPGGVPPTGRLFLQQPADALDRLVAQMRSLWEVALAPWWGVIADLLEAEVAWRARRLASVGPQAAFAGLHETVSWHDGTLSVIPTAKAAEDVELAGRGLLLVPAAFTWPSVWPRTDPPWEPALVYPPPGVADLWRGDEPPDGALSTLIGSRRALILLELERPAATLDLAARIGSSAGGVSEHLRVLRDAGLVTARREGRWVIYSRTAIGDALCASRSTP